MFYMPERPRRKAGSFRYGDEYGLPRRGSAEPHFGLIKPQFAQGERQTAGFSKSNAGYTHLLFGVFLDFNLIFYIIVGFNAR